MSEDVQTAIEELSGLLEVLNDPEIKPEEIVEEYERGPYISAIKLAILALAPSKQTGGDVSGHDLLDLLIDLLAIVKGDLGGKAQIEGVIREADDAILAARQEGK